VDRREKMSSEVKMYRRRLDEVKAPKRLIEVVKDFERTDQRYIV